MTPTPSAREPQDHIADAGNMVEPQALTCVTCGIADDAVRALFSCQCHRDMTAHVNTRECVKALRAAYDALAAEREALVAERNDWADRFLRLSVSAESDHNALAAAERERDALRGVVEKARQLDAVVYGNRPGGAGSFDERHRAQVEFIASLRALDGEARG